MSTRFDYCIHGPETGDWITFSHPVGSSLDIWAGQIEAFSRRHRVLTYNTRGHGKDRPNETHGSVDDLASDVLELWRHLSIERSHFVGLSLGGCVGVALAHRAPQSVQSLAVVNARLEIDADGAGMWLQRAQTVEQQGLAPILAPMLERWLTPAFMAEQPTQVERVSQTVLATSPNGFAACCRALAAMHQEHRLAGLQVPTLLMTGLSDKAIPSTMVEHYARQNPSFELATLQGPHILNLENPTAFNRTVLDFIERH